MNQTLSEQKQLKQAKKMLDCKHCNPISYPIDADTKPEKLNALFCGAAIGCLISVGVVLAFYTF